jgi:hypothetical protein
MDNYSNSTNNNIESVSNLVDISASVTPTDPSLVVSEGFEFSNANIIPSELISGSFAPQDPSSSIELFIYDLNNNIITNNYNYTSWKVTQNTEVPNVSTTYINDQGIEVQESSTSSLTTDLIEIDPASDSIELGVDNGEVYTLYNFITNELGSSNINPFYVDEISSDRTEIRLRSNTIDNNSIREGYTQLKSKLDSSEYFDEFYINFYNNIYSIGINILLEEDLEKGPSILIKTFTPIPSNIEVEDFAYVVTKQSETLAYQVNFYEDFSNLLDSATYIKGPNINIPLQDLVNNSTVLKSYNEATETISTGSLNTVLHYLNQKGVFITPNYSYNTFDEFVNFSSVKERVLNFYEKVSEIEGYQNDIDLITTTTGSNPNVPQISQSIADLENKITNVIKNFDGYEYYLYYTSSSFAYPKEDNTYPYTLQSTGSTEVLEWLGSDVEGNAYYGGYLLSASLYDEDNQNWLYYAVPDFIKENADNNNYISFVNMVGQTFDEIWLYTKALSERFNTTNDPESGLPLNLASEAIKHLGFESFGNNFNSQDNFIGLIGEDNESYVPPTGSELINNYIAINNGEFLNYWNLEYSVFDYVEQIFKPGFPYPIDKVSKEIYKRLYHNMAYLTKKKGTISGLRQLINIWGIPNTILRINEFGGKNRDNTDDYDLWYKRYSYAFNTLANSAYPSASIRVPWMPLERNYIADDEYIVPDGVAVRFKTTGHPSAVFGSNYTQSIIVKKSNGNTDDQFDWGVGLYYEDQPSGSYSGSSNSDYYNYGKLRFYISGSAADGGVAISNDIFLPFFDGGWWSILLQRDTHVSASDSSQDAIYTLYVGNKQDNGWDGNSIGWTGSVTISSAGSSSLNESWNNFGTTSNDGVYVGGYVSGSKVINEVLNPTNRIFSGSFQEFRYYSHDIAQTVFNDFVMNPESIEGNNITGSESSFDIVNFRAPLGNELEHIFTASVSQSDSYSEFITSSHPAITGSAISLITQSFINPADSSLTSSYEFIYFTTGSSIKTYSEQNVETYFLDQPSIGVRNRVSNKIQVESGEYYGTTLSKYRSIQQDYLISKSYTEDITNLEVGFSPQDEVNDDIIASFGYGVVSNTLADPSFAFEGTQAYYPNLRNIAQEYFEKYKNGNIWDYIRLIKYFDNSIFKAIKSYVPARTSVTTGIIIKQHMLERNRRVPVRVNPDTTIAYTPSGSMNTPFTFRNLEITSSIAIGSITGSTGGSAPNLEGNVSSSGAGFNIVPLTQSWSASHATPKGLIEYIDETQTEFYDGEYSGSIVEVTNGILLDNPYSPSQTLNTSYVLAVTSSTGRWSSWTDSALTTYPSFSLDCDVIAVTQSSIGVSQLYSFIDNLPAGLSGKSNRGYIALQQADDKFYIQGLVFPMRAKFFSGASFNTIPGLLYDVDKTKIARFPNNIPLPPEGTDPRSGSPRYNINNLGPYFKLDISSSIFDGSATVDGGTPADFIADPNLSNLSSSVVSSIFLGENNTPDLYATSSDGVGFVIYHWTNPLTINQRPIKVNGTPDQTPSNFFTSNTFSVDWYISNYDYNYNGANAGTNDTPWGGSWYKEQTANPPSIGSGSLFLQGTTWTGSYGDFGHYAIYGLTLNDKNYDEFNNVINNQNTLANNPSFQFTVFESSSGVPTSEDTDGLSGSLFDQSLTTFDTINLAVNDPNLSSILYEYEYENSRGLSGSDAGSSDGLYLPTGSQPLQYLNFSPQLPIDNEFYNTPYNSLINNATSSVKNTYVQVIEYDDGPIPSNIDQIISGSAQKASIPDSFYTQKSIITPRYLGSKLQTETYNFVSKSSDVNFGTMKSTNTSLGTVYKAPIYFAHFKTSKENYELWDTYTFKIDSLIQVPLEDITGNKAPDLPTIIKVDGKGDNLTNVRSTFETDREVLVSYNQFSKFQSGSNVAINYASVAQTKKQIFQGSLEYNTVLTTEQTKTNYTPTSSFVTSSQIVIESIPGNDTFELNGEIVSSWLTESTYPTSASYENGKDCWLITGSNYLELGGGGFMISASLGKVIPAEAEMDYYGSSLTLMHSYNKWVKNQLYAENSNSIPGLPSGSYIDPNDNNNYFVFDFITSSLESYEDFNLPFLIETGDEIRVTYNAATPKKGSFNTPTFITQDFTVTDAGDRGNITTTDIVYDGGNPQSITGSRVFNRIEVYPDPSTLDTPILNGKIYNFTIRRRVNTDDRVIIYQNPPTGSNGVKTLSPSGFLVPNDMTPTQKKNVQSLISQLNAKNTFKDDDRDDQTP